jgi:hypothetical protein
MLTLGECRLLLFGNSGSGMRSGLVGRRRGGAIAPKSVRESIETVLIDSPAAAFGGVVRRYLNMPRTKMMPAGTLAEVTPCFSGQDQNDRLDGEKGVKQSQP